MGIGITIISAIVLGTIIGVSLTITFLFLKNYFQTRRLLKKNPDLVKDIELNKKTMRKITDERDKKKGKEKPRERGRERGRGGDTRDDEDDEEVEPAPRREREPDKADEHSSDKVSSSERRRVSVSDIGFTLRD